MKNASVLMILAIVLFISCEKQTERPYSYMLTGIKASKGNVLVTVNIDTGNIENTFSIEYYVVGSTFFDNVTGCYGYVNGDGFLKLIEPLTGIERKSIELPGFLSFAVIDESTHELIGLYFDQGKEIKSACDTTPGPGGTYGSYVLKVDLTEGTVVSNQKVNIDDGLVSSVYYYDKPGKKLVVLQGDLNLLKIDPVTGSTEVTVRLEKNLFNAAYNEKDNTLVGLVYLPEDNSYNLEVINASTGNTLISNKISNEESFCLNVSGFDSETLTYFTVNGNYEVILYDVSSGNEIKRLKLEDPLNDLKFWKRKP